MQRSALRSGMIPIINQMSAAGIITLPGMMTGQILAGMSPFEAAKYQILVLLLLAGGAGFGAIAATWLAVRRVTDVATGCGSTGWPRSTDGLATAAARVRLELGRQSRAGRAGCRGRRRAAG